MDTSVIGIYKSSSNAQSAMNELLKAGFSQDNLQLSGGGQRKEASGGVARSLKEETGVGEFYRTMYGREDTQMHAEAYEHAAGQGNAILTVNAPSEEMAHRAAEVMERFEPVDVEEYASIVALGLQDEIQEGRSQSTDAAMTAGPSGAGSSRTSRTAATGRAEPPATASASPKTSEGAIRDDIQKGRPLDMRKGVRMYQRSSGAPVQRNDDSLFRSHWQNVYGTSGGKYDDYGPAYRYGSELKSNERWRGRQWSEMESGVRSDWEAKNPKDMWEKFKDSIRYGWENATGTYEDETRSMSDRMAPGMGAEPGLGDRGERSRPSTSVSPGTGTSATGRPQGAAMSGGMSTSGASFTSDTERRSAMGTPRDTRSASDYESGASPVGKDDVQKGRSQTTQAAATAGSSGASSPQKASTTGTTNTSASVRGGGAHVPDDAEYRSHWQHSYWTSGGSYDDYAPAYRYGADYADNDTNPNHQWGDVESRMRGDWEAYNRDPGSWDKNKEAIRYGWEKGKMRGKGTHSGQALR